MRKVHKKVRVAFYHNTAASLLVALFVLHERDARKRQIVFDRMLLFTRANKRLRALVFLFAECYFDLVCDLFGGKFTRTKCC